MKETFNLVAVVPGAFARGALASGAFGGGYAVPCDISKRSKCVETIPHVEKLSRCLIMYG